MNTRQLFKIGVVSFILLFVGAVYVSFGAVRDYGLLLDHLNLIPVEVQDEVCFDELDGECYKIADVIVLPVDVEVQESLPHRPVQEYEYE